MTLSNRLQRSFAAQQAAAIERNGLWRSWGEVGQLAGQVNAILTRQDIAPDVRVGLIGRNRPWTTSAFLGILAEERCVVPINPFQPQDRILQDVAQLDLAALIGEPEDYENGAIAACARELGFAALMLDGARWSIELLEGRRQNRDLLYEPNALLMATSGTTGPPKRVPIRKDTLLTGAIDAQSVGLEFGEEPLPPSQQSPLIQYSPLVHIGGALSVARAGVHGRRLIVPEKFKADDWVAAIERFGHRSAGLPPAMMRMVIELNPPADALRSLVAVWSGSAPIDRAVARSFSDRYGATVLGSYGATEFCGVVANGRLADVGRFGPETLAAVGRIRPNVANARIVDPSGGAPLGFGSQGLLELQVHRVGPEWMRTSDLAALDPNGFLYLYGRADDAINRGGFKIVPTVITDVLKSHPAVRDAAVVGVRHERLGEAPVAVVEIEGPDAQVSSEDLMAFARARLVAYQVPLVIRVVDRLPRTPSMKIDRQAVKALF